MKQPVWLFGVLLACLLGTGRLSAQKLKPSTFGDLSSFAKLEQHSVVRVLATVLLKQNQDGSTPYKQCTGTGYVVNNEGYIVTAWHTLDEVKRYGVPTYTAEYADTLTQEQRAFRRADDFGVPVEVVATDIVRDLAVLKPLKATKQKPVYLSTDHVFPGEDLVLLGFPLNLETLAVRTGVISTTDKGEIESPGRFKEAYWADLRISTGDSGSPVFRKTDGAVVGMVLKFANQPSDENSPKYNAGLSYVLASTYVISLLREHTISFNTR